jgi:hypothetical protein
MSKAKGGGQRVYCRTMNRRTLLSRSLAASLASASCADRAGAAESPWRIAPFEADVTPPMGHPCMGGGVAPVQSVTDPLFIRGCVLLGPQAPVILASIEWCEIRNASFDAWRSGLAKAAGTEPARVLLSSTHVHNAPVMDEEAEAILKKAGSAGSVCDPAFNREAIARAAAAIESALKTARPLTHFATGKAKVEGVASNRRVVLPDGIVTYGRMSRCIDPRLREAADGTIDPWLKTLSFWSGDELLFALHTYAVHPMSYYGGGDVTADFPGLALQAIRKSHPEMMHVYASGCSGNVTAGKYNDGSPGNRPVLAQRLHTAMDQSIKAMQRQPITQAKFRHAPLTLEPRTSLGFSEAALNSRLRDPKERPFGQCLAAMGLSWLARVQRGQPIDVPLVDFGGAAVLLLPAESYVEFQLLAQELSGDKPVLVMGYGECAPGYIPIERAWREKDTNLHDWCWINPGSEEKMNDAIRKLIRG